MSSGLIHQPIITNSFEIFMRSMQREGKIVNLQFSFRNLTACPRTPLDVNAKVNGKHIDLYRLFEIVAARGGYDAVSAEKLAWRKIGQEFNLGQTNAAAYAFALKTTYYKNLAYVDGRGTCRFIFD